MGPAARSAKLHMRAGRFDEALRHHGALAVGAVRERDADRRGHYHALSAHGAHPATGRATAWRGRSRRARRALDVADTPEQRVHTLISLRGGACRPSAGGAKPPTDASTTARELAGEGSVRGRGLPASPPTTAYVGKPPPGRYRSRRPRHATTRDATRGRRYGLAQPASGLPLIGRSALQPALSWRPTGRPLATCEAAGQRACGHEYGYVFLKALVDDCRSASFVRLLRR